MDFIIPFCLGVAQANEFFCPDYLKKARCSVLYTTKHEESLPQKANYFTKLDNYGIQRAYINSTKVINVAKKYFNCNTIEGVELENYGGELTAGSHWEARILYGEYMTGYVPTQDQVISEFTLALLEDSGYYKVNYYTGG